MGNKQSGPEAVREGARKRQQELNDSMVDEQRKNSSPEEKVAGKLKEKFSNVDIDKKKVSLAESALKKATANNVNSKLIHDKIVGLKVNNIDGLAEIVIEELDLADENEAKKKVRTAFRKIKLVDEDGGGVDSHVEELKLDVAKDNEFKCVYGFITAILKGGLVHVAYAIYELQFDIEMKEGMGFEIAEIEAIRNHYSKDQALKTMMQENVIKEISYSDV